MFEIVKAIHEALRTQSTVAFVAFIAVVFGLGGGLIAWLVDGGYKNSLKESREKSLVVEVEINTRKLMTIHNRGGIGLEDVRMDVIKYIFDKDSWFNSKLKIDSFYQWKKLFSVEKIPAYSDSNPIDLSTLPLVTFQEFADYAKSLEKTPDDELAQRTCYALRITFRDERTKEKYVYYRVTSSLKGMGYIFEDDHGVSAAGGSTDLLQYHIPEVIKSHLENLYGKDIREYKP